MTHQELTNSLKAKLADNLVSVEQSTDLMVYTVLVDWIFETIEFLQTDENAGFAFLTDLCGVHYPGQELELGVVYHLHNMRTGMRIRLKTFVSITQPDVPSITSLFSSANWMERETFDFYGINFVGHPNLIRILNVEYLDFFPMRKDIPLEDPTRDDKDNRFFGR